jgi:hypothetical protein
VINELFMKRIINHSSGKSDLFFSPLFTFFVSQGKHFLLLAFACIILTGCFRHFYKVNSKEVADTTLVGQLKADDKYFILHCEDKVMGTQHLGLVNDQLEADLVALPKEHAHHTNPALNTKNVMKSKQQANTLKEVHLYSSTPVASDQKHIALPITAINRIDVYEMDAGATRQSHILSAIGLTAAGILIAGTLIFILTGGLAVLP